MKFLWPEMDGDDEYDDSVPKRGLGSASLLASNFRVPSSPRPPPRDEHHGLRGTKRRKKNIAARSHEHLRICGTEAFAGLPGVVYYFYFYLFV